MSGIRLRPVRLALCVASLVAADCKDSDTVTNIVGTDSLSYALAFSTYLGGGSTDMVRDAAIDLQGNVYVAGSTRSPDFPTTAGVFQPAFNSSPVNLADAFIAKFDPNGQLLWSTFLGGPGYERIYGLEVDELGFVYVAGRAGAGFPVTAGAFQTTFAGSVNPQADYGPTDGFVCKIRPDGTQVVFCSYFGNDDFEPIRDLAIDANHDIIVGTSAVSAIGLPAGWFANAYQKTIHGDRDGLVAKIKGDGSQVEWATFLGGADYESNGISVRASTTGILVATSTKSLDLPTPNGFDHSLSGGSDLYLAKLSLDGSSLVYATYVGGSGSEATETHHLGVDSDGNALVAIQVGVGDFPVPATAFQPQSGGHADILVAKVAPDGRLVAATYLGGSEGDWAEGVTTDASGNVYLTGLTGSDNFPITGGSGAQGGSDLIAVTLSPDLAHLLFSRRLGGGGADYGRAVAVSPTAFVVAGMSDASNWPLAAAAQGALRGGTDGIIASFARQH